MAVRSKLDLEVTFEEHRRISRPTPLALCVYRGKVMPPFMSREAVEGRSENCRHPWWISIGLMSPAGTNPKTHP